MKSTSMPHIRLGVEAIFESPYDGDQPFWSRREDELAEDDRYDRGAEMLKKVYAGDVDVPEKGTMAFSDLMIENLFAEVWTRDVLSIRDRRLILLGVIGALGERDTFAIQVKATLKNEELTPDQLREVLIMLANYAGYPRAAGMLGIVEQQIAAFTRDQQKDPKTGS